MEWRLLLPCVLGGIAFAAPCGASRDPPELRDAIREGAIPAVRSLPSRIADDLAPSGVATLADDAADPFTLRDLGSGVEIQVKPRDMRASAGERFGELVLYPNAHASGADIVHRKGPRGTEDFWYFREAPSAEEIAYEILPGSAAGGLRWSGSTLEILDAHGAARIAVSASYLVDAAGRYHATKLALDGCPVDPSGRWQTDAPRDGKRVCTLRVAWRGEELVYPVLLDPSWETLEHPPQQRRYLHTVTRTQGVAFVPGPIIVAGGRFCASADPTVCVDLSDVSQIDPTGPSWGYFDVVNVAPMGVARSAHAAAPLEDLSLLVAGGASTAAAKSAEVYSNSTQSWSAVGSMSLARSYHTLTPRILETFVLAAGGYGCNGASCGPVGFAELYHPPSKSWGLTGELVTPRYKHTATQMLPPQAFVLVAGGLDASGDSLASAELYDPISFSWVPTGNMLTARHGHSAEIVYVKGKSRVLVAGGTKCTAGSCQILSSAELYDPVTGKWTATGNMTVPRTGHVSEALSGCRTLAAGGSSSGSDALSSAELYDQVAGTWSATESMATARSEAQSARRVDGTVVVVGGSGGSVLGLTGAERFRPCPGACGSDVASCECPDCLDSDEDGLSDVWETAGVDTNCDGAVDLDLPALGAKAQRKDIFFELDYMEGGSPPHADKPEPSVVQTVVDAFAKAPVPNPDGSTGISLHIELAPIPHYEFLDYQIDPSCSGSVMADFDVLKLVHFDPSRRRAFHYGIWGHRNNCNGDFAGSGELPGDDVLYTPFLYSSDLTYRAALLMHELGHNLKLPHGFGGNRNPNYLSVMNYAFGFGIPPAKRVDFSRSQLPDLDEAALVESSGIQDGSDQTYHFCKPGGTPVLAAGTGEIDWNCNGSTDTQSVQVDVDGSTSIGKLKGIDNWKIATNENFGGNMRLPFQCNQGHNEPAAFTQVEPEIDLETLRAQYLAEPLLAVAIDLWPGCDDSPIALRERRDVPVAILATRSVDVAEVDVDSVRFAGAPVASSEQRDVDGDGVQDLLLHFRTQDLELVSQSTRSLLLGALRSRQPIQGEAAVRMVDSYECTCVEPDVTPPEIEVRASPELLWPPNHRMVRIQVELSASDRCDSDPDVSLVSATSNEPDDVRGDTDGSTVGDVQARAIDDISLRAERDTQGAGRIYTLTFGASDAAGNASTAAAEVRVPLVR